MGRCAGACWTSPSAAYDCTAAGERRHDRLSRAARGGEAGRDALLDGEIVAFVDGRPSFEALQSRMHVRSKAEARRLAAQTPVTYVAFDVLRRFGVDLTARPYERAARDAGALARRDDPAWTLSPSFDDGPATEARRAPARSRGRGRQAR